MASDPFNERVAFVTGAASGIGAALTRQLAQRGARVFAADIDAAGAEAHAASVNAACGSTRVTAVALDVTDRDAFETAFAAAHDEAGRIDLLFNNAGIAVIGNVLKMQAQHWDRLVDVNIRGVHHGVEAAYARMTRQEPLGAGRKAWRGHIVNTASVAGLLPSPGFTGYAMTKHAVVGLSVSLREEALRYGVRVSALCPGVINTNMAESAQLLGSQKRLKDEVPEADARLPDADYCARKALIGVARNRAIIPVTAAAHVGWRLWRLWPPLVKPITRRLAETLAPLD